MSIYTLNKKSRRFKAHISGIGKDGFSLVGGYRNIGVVGTTNLAKSVTRTPFRGTTPMGHGGSGNSFPIFIANSGSCNTNNPSIIKKTVKNNKGAILEQYKWIHSAYPHFWTKNINNSNENYTQGEYIKNAVVKSGTCVTNKLNSGINNCGGNINCKSASYHIGGKKIYRSIYSKNLNIFPTSSSEYQRSQLLRTNNLPTPECLKHFPFSTNTTSCANNFLTPKQAIQANALPSNWMNCPKC